MNINLCRIGRTRWFDRDQRLDFVGGIEGGPESEIAALAVDDNDAGAHLLYQCIIGGLRGRIVCDPPGYTLLRELVESLDRELRALIARASAPDLIGRSDSKKLPGLLLGPKEGSLLYISG